MAEIELDIQQPITELPAIVDGQPEEATAVMTEDRPAKGAVPPPKPQPQKKKKNKRSRPANRHEEEESLMSFGLKDWESADESFFSFKTLRRYFAGPVLVGFIRHNRGFLIMVVGMMLVYIGLGYQIRDYTVRNERMTNELEDRRYKALTRSSELHERSLGSRVVETLKDTALHLPTQHLYMLPVKKMAEE